MSTPEALSTRDHTPWPALWAGRSHFCVLDTGGRGLLGFLQLWQAWRRDPQRCDRLHVVLLFEDAAAAAAEAGLQQAARLEAGGGALTLDSDLLPTLRAAWPPLTANLHPLELDAARVHLLIGLGPLNLMLPRLRMQADGAWIDAAAALPADQRLRVLKAVARLCQEGALVCGAPATAGLLADLRTAGYAQDAQAPAGQVWARHRPHAGRVRFPIAAVAAEAPEQPCTALVIGAGVAGAAAAQALAQQGLAVTVLDRHALPAAETSGNPAALFHGTVNPDDSLYARLFRAAALVAQRSYAAAGPSVRAEVHGLLRLQPTPGQPAEHTVQHMQEQLQRLGLPDDYVQAVTPTQASALAGLPLSTPAWFYPGGGWIDPASWVRAVLAGDGVQFRGQMAVHSLRRVAGAWQALDSQGVLLAQADVVVLACTSNCAPLVEALSPGLQWPLRQSRGLVTQFSVAGASASAPDSADPAQAPRLPVAGDGYALPLRAQKALLCGATRQAVEVRDRPGPFALHVADPEDTSTPGAAPWLADHQHNLLRLRRLTGLQPAPGTPLLGRVGWRLQADDRLPIAGALPKVGVAAVGAAEPGLLGTPPVRLDQARRWPRWAGLFVLTALGARGLTLAPLLGRLVAAQATGTPWPLERELADALDPVRWALRAARQDQARAQAQLQAAGRAPPAQTEGPAQDAG
jgi:tRNA 5-methylaminomethyl-2-thiouridine biosynthesis bifunctional protein